MIKLTTLLREIGDAGAKVYGDLNPTGRGQGYYKYEFTTESGTQYVVHVLKFVETDESRPVLTTEFTVAFHVKEREWEEETNKGELYKIMATVVGFVRRVVQSDPSSKDGTEKAIVFVPAKKDPNDNRRLNLYTAYVKRQIPGSEIVGPDADGKLKVYLPRT